MNKIMTWILGLFSLGVIYFITSNIDKKLTESQYVLNTYMYILLGILLSSLTWKVLDDHINITNLSIPFRFFGVFILSLISLFVVMTTTNDVYIIKNIAWGVFVISIGIMTYITYKNNVHFGKMQNILLEFIGIVAVLSYIAYSMPVDTFKTIHVPLLYILLVLIIIEFVDFFINNHTRESYINMTRIYGWITVILFSGFILYDTQKILYDAKIHTTNCNTQNQLECVDYPVASLGIFLDIANLFTGLSAINR